MGYVMRARVATVAQEKMFETMSKYNGSKEIQIVWDNLQKEVNTGIICLSFIRSKTITRSLRYISELKYTSIIRLIRILASLASFGASLQVFHAARRAFPIVGAIVTGIPQTTSATGIISERSPNSARI